MSSSDLPGCFHAVIFSFGSSDRLREAVLFFGFGPTARSADEAGREFPLTCDHPNKDVYAVSKSKINHRIITDSNKSGFIGAAAEIWRRQQVIKLKRWTFYRP